MIVCWVSERQKLLFYIKITVDVLFPHVLVCGAISRYKSKLQVAEFFDTDVKSAFAWNPCACPRNCLRLSGFWSAHHQALQRPSTGHVYNQKCRETSATWRAEGLQDQDWKLLDLRHKDMFNLNVYFSSFDRPSCICHTCVWSHDVPLVVKTQILGDFKIEWYFWSRHFYSMCPDRPVFVFLHFFLKCSLLFNS